jgi:UPF0755 protein
MRGGKKMLDDLDLAWEEQNEPRRQRRGGPPSRQARQRRRKERKRRGRSVGALAISMLLLAVLGLGVYWGVGRVQDYFGAPDYTGNPATTPVNVKVNDQDTSTDIANTLFAKKVVKSAKAFIKAADANPESKNIQPGTYRLFEQMPAKTALAALLNPDKYLLVNRVLITEGTTTKKAFELLSKGTGIPVAQFEAAAKDPVALGIPAFWFNRDTADGRQAIKSVEGFLFPDTYGFSPDDDATAILKKMIRRFLDVADKLNIVAIAQQKGITPFEALTVASLVEKEAGTKADMPKIARVVYNRLKPEWEANGCGCLQFDSTTNYWRQLKGLAVKPSSQMTQAELDDPTNPYNTAVKPGLPPGPISNPGEDALTAAINPASGTWVYFVLIDKNGNSAFATTLAEHNRNVAKAQANGVG